MYTQKTGRWGLKVNFGKRKDDCVCGDAKHIRVAAQDISMQYI